MAKSKKSAAAMMDAAKKAVEKGKDKSAIVKVQRYQASAEEARSLSNEIQEDFQKWKNAAGKGWWELGIKVEKFIAVRGPEAMGQSFSKWAEKIFGEAWQSIRRAFLSVKSLKGVPVEKLEKISEGNAYQMHRLPEKIRTSAEWLKKAADFTHAEFKEETERFIEKKTKTKRDPMTPLSDALGFSTIPKTLAKKVKEVMKIAGRNSDPQLDLDTKQGRIDAFELIFSEFELSQANVVQDPDGETEAEPEDGTEEERDVELSEEELEITEEDLK